MAQSFLDKLTGKKLPQPITAKQTKLPPIQIGKDGPRLDDENTTDDRWYNSKVAEARDKLNKYRKFMADANKIRMSVAKLTSIVEKRGQKITVWAEDIGIGYTTLKKWCNDYKKSTTQIVAELEDKGEEIDHAALNRAKNKITPKTPPSKARQVYEEEKKKSNEDILLDKTVKLLNTANFNLCHKLVLERLDKNQLGSCYKLSNEIAQSIESVLGAKKVGILKKEVPKAEIRH
jgi:hypothetical protein